MHRVLIIFIFMLLLPTIQAQQVATAPVHNTKKATLYSSFVPGMGQIYNKKFWKAPIVWVGVGGLAYYGSTKYSDFNTLKKACAYKEGNSSYTNEEIDLLTAQYSSSQLNSLRNSSQRSFEISCIAFVAWWLLNIVDATVDAYLFDYDISDDLSMHIEPMQLNSIYSVSPVSMNTGLTLIINF